MHIIKSVILVSDCSGIAMNKLLKCKEVCQSTSSQLCYASLATRIKHIVILNKFRKPG